MVIVACLSLSLMIWAWSAFRPELGSPCFSRQEAIANILYTGFHIFQALDSSGTLRNCLTPPSETLGQYKSLNTVFFSFQGSGNLSDIRKWLLPLFWGSVQKVPHELTSVDKIKSRKICKFESSHILLFYINKSCLICHIFKVKHVSLVGTHIFSLLWTLWAICRVQPVNKFSVICGYPRHLLR
jgi:hypothetical protein